MANIMLETIGWGLFYWVVFLYIFWVIVERTFFADSDPERWEPKAQTETPEATGDLREPLLRVPRISTLGRPA